MEPISTIAGITAVLPLLTSGVKALFKPKIAKLTEEQRHAIHAAVPLVLGILSAGLYQYHISKDWVLALAVGLGSGAAAASARDVNKDLAKIISTSQAMIEANPKVKEKVRGWFGRRKR